MIKSMFMDDKPKVTYGDLEKYIVGCLTSINDGNTSAIARTITNTTSSLTFANYLVQGNAKYVADKVPGTNRVIIAGASYLWVVNINQTTGALTIVTTFQYTFGSANDVRVSPDGTKVAVVAGSWVGVFSYDNATAAFTLHKVLQTDSMSYLKCTWSYDNKYLFVCRNQTTSPIMGWLISGTTYTAQTITGLPATGIYDIHFRPGTYEFAGISPTSTTKFLSTYVKSGSTWVLKRSSGSKYGLASVSNAALQYFPDGEHIAVSQGSTATTYVAVWIENSAGTGFDDVNASGKKTISGSLTSQRLRVSEDNIHMYLSNTNARPGLYRYTFENDVITSNGTENQLYNGMCLI